MESVEQPTADPHGVNVGCLVGIILIALAVSAIPYGGVVTLVFGYWISGWARNKRSRALSYVLQAPLIDATRAKAGDRIDVAARVTGPESAVKTPLGRSAVVATAWMDDELGDETEDRTPTWTAQYGERIELEADGATLVVESDAIQILSKSVTTTKQHSGEPPAHVPLEVRKDLKKGCEEYGERWLDVGTEVVVSGLVASVEDKTIHDQVAGYRGHRRIAKVSIVAPAGGAVRVTTFTPSRIAELAREAQAEIIGGSIMMVVAVLSLLYWAT